MSRLLVLMALLPACVSPAEVESETQAASMGLAQVMGYGDQYDGLKMWKYVPAGVPPNAPLVLALHPCGFVAQLNDYASKIGWNALADKYKFYLVYPEQIAANNGNYCFNWAGDKTGPDGHTNQPTNLIRGMGENQELVNMVKRMQTDHSIDPARVFITGFSGGAAQTALMLAVWPDVFAAGATVAGVPYHCTLDKNEVSSPCMKPGKNLTGQQWGDFVRTDLPTGYSGPWPRLQIWQGATDNFVGPDNLNQLAKQWINVRGISATATTDRVLGHDHAVYKDAQGNVVIESFLVSGMGHAVPLDPKNGCGTADFNYYLDKGICATQKAAEFFGLQNPPSPISDGGTATTDAGGDAGPVSDGSVDPGHPGTPQPTKPMCQGGCCGGCSTAPGSSDASWILICLAVALAVRARRTT